MTTIPFIDNNITQIYKENSRKNIPIEEIEYLEFLFDSIKRNINDIIEDYEEFVDNENAKINMKQLQSKSK